MTTPNQGRPDGAYSIAAPGDYQYGQDGLNESAVLGLAANGVKVKFEAAQTVHQNEVKGKFTSIEAELISSGAVTSDHENRLTWLESGNVVAEYFSNDIWEKPNSEPNFHHDTFIAIAGGGGGGRSRSALNIFDGADRPGYYGGGQGGYGAQDVLHGSAPSTVDVVIGVGGAGAEASGPNAVNGSDGTSTAFSSGGTFFLAGGGPGGKSTYQSAGSGSYPEWQASGGRGKGVEGGINGGPIPGQPGGDGYLCQGGAYRDADFGAGGEGGACPAGRIGPGAGGGGSGFEGNGGPGGFPGGAGGAAGTNKSIFDAGLAGRGGNGSIGRAVIISSRFA